jgi:FkbM family methyltransferase
MWKRLDALIEALVRRRPPEVRERLLCELASQLGIVSIGSDGELGRFYGSTRDRVVYQFYLRYRTYAPEIQSILKNAVFSAGKGTLIDVGANIGLTSIPVAKSCGVTCYAFEPDPENYRLLMVNIAANEAGDRVSAFNLAAMSMDGTFDFEQSPTNMGDHRIRNTALLSRPAESFGERGWSTVKVQGRSLDSVFADRKLERPIAMKVDTQGAEVQVFAGGRGVLKQVDVVIAEYWPYGLLRAGDSPDRYFDEIGTFEFAAILEPNARGPVRLFPTREVVAELRRRIPVDGTSVAHGDVLLARTPTVSAP